MATDDRCDHSHGQMMNVSQPTSFFAILSRVIGCVRVRTELAAGMIAYRGRRPTPVLDHTQPMSSIRAGNKMSFVAAQPVTTSRPNQQIARFTPMGERPGDAVR
jgi:hypothetical protein